MHNSEVPKSFWFINAFMLILQRCEQLYSYQGHSLASAVSLSITEQLDCVSATWISQRSCSSDILSVVKGGSGGIYMCRWLCCICTITVFPFLKDSLK